MFIPGVQLHHRKFHWGSWRVRLLIGGVPPFCPLPPFRTAPTVLCSYSSTSVHRITILRCYRICSVSKNIL